MKYLVENDMINLATISQDIEMQNRKMMLEKHPCQIWQGKTNGMWYTHIRNSNGERRLIKKRTREKLEDAIIEHYEQQKKTVSVLFDEWLKEKETYDGIQKSTRDRYKADFVKYFGSFGNRKIDAISEIDIEYFIKDTINKFNLTNKAYSGLRLLLLGIFGYAKKHRLTEISIQAFFRDLALPKKIFRTTKKLASDNVFTADEVSRISEYLLSNDPNVLSFGILLGMRTGLRVGELSTLKFEDIQNGAISVYKTEIRYKDNSGQYVHEVRQNAKTEAGNRMVIIDREAESLIEKIRGLNPDGEYLFEIDGKRCIGQSFTRKLERACTSLKIKPRSMHKCRKTYATNLINANIPESFIIAQMGHVDISTTRNFYLYDNTEKQEAVKYLEQALPSNHQ